MVPGAVGEFVDGSLAASTPDSEMEVGVSGGSLRFFLDDDAQDSGPEESSGRVSWISVFDEPLDDAAIATLSDPESWGDVVASAPAGAWETGADGARVPR